MSYTHYYLNFSYANNAKNKLQENFEKYLKSLHAKLIPAEELEEMKSAIILKAVELNTKYTSCKALNIVIWEFDTGIFKLQNCNVYFDICPAILTNVQSLK